MLVHQMDVETAFLNGDLNEEIYMKHPKGHVVKGMEHLVCKLKKSLYYLKQSPRCMNQTFSKYLENIGLKKNKSDSCIYIRYGKDLSIIAVYVDDLILFVKNNVKMNEIKKKLKLRFKMKDMGEIHYCLGISIEYNKTKN